MFRIFFLILSIKRRQIVQQKKHVMVNWSFMEMKRVSACSLFTRLALYEMVKRDAQIRSNIRRTPN